MVKNRANEKTLRARIFGVGQRVNSRVVKTRGIALRAQDFRKLGGREKSTISYP
jgi:hypothetical protein